MKRIIPTLIITILLANISVTYAANINFDDLASGAVLTNQYSSLGVTFSLLDTSPGYVKGPTVWQELSLPGSVDYPGANGTVLVPGDDIYDPFYDVKISFSKVIDYFSFHSFDSDEPLTVKGYLHGSLIQTAFYPPGSDLQEWHLELGSVDGTLHFDEVILDVVPGVPDNTFGGPELYDNLSYHEVPLPNSLWFLGSGLLGLAGWRRFRQG